jgi:hypothetical protein
MHFEAVGYPRMTEPADAFWNAVSLVRNARRIAVPILLQLSDDEAMSALPTFTALREVDGAIDMFVFPDERHVKWQPAHRLAMYRRSLDWFDFWLRDRRSSEVAPKRSSSSWAVYRLAAYGNVLRDSCRDRTRLLKRSPRLHQVIISARHDFQLIRVPA